ncbi:phage terminase large subunit [Novosphingobium olei]|nr:phage terminase large subunit [Novosphingobium olei]
MQRLHENDLVGHLLERGNWEILSLPAIAEEDEEWVYDIGLGPCTWRRQTGEALHPARESLATLAEQRASMTSYDYAAQYQQRPAPAGGGEIRPEWFGTYSLQSPPPFIRKIQCWDTAATDGARSDYSVCVTLGEARDRQFYVVDLYRGRLLYPELKRKARELAELHSVDQVVIEKCAASEALIEELRREGYQRIHPVKPKGSKYERILARTALIEAGRVWLPQHAHWTADFLHEAAMFPHGKHDDQLDALAYGLQWLTEYSGAAHWLATMEEVERRRAEQW